MGRRLTLCGHRVPCTTCGKNASHILASTLDGVHVYCNEHYSQAYDRLMIYADMENHRFIRYLIENHPEVLEGLMNKGESE